MDQSLGVFAWARGSPVKDSISLYPDFEEPDGSKLTIPKENRILWHVYSGSLASAKWWISKTNRAVAVTSSFAFGAKEKLIIVFLSLQQDVTFNCA